MAQIDSVAERMRISWAEVTMLPLYEFLNVICYIHDRNVRERNELERWKAQHRR